MGRKPENKAPIVTAEITEGELTRDLSHSPLDEDSSVDGTLDDAATIHSKKRQMIDHQRHFRKEVDLLKTAMRDLVYLSLMMNNKVLRYKDGVVLRRRDLTGFLRESSRRLANLPKLYQQGLAVAYKRPRKEVKMGAVCFVGQPLIDFYTGEGSFLGYVEPGNPLSGLLHEALIGLRQHGCCTSNTHLYLASIYNHFHKCQLENDRQFYSADDRMRNYLAPYFVALELLSPKHKTKGKFDRNHFRFTNWSSVFAQARLKTPPPLTEEIREQALKDITLLCRAAQHYTEERRIAHQKSHLNETINA